MGFFRAENLTELECNNNNDDDDKNRQRIKLICE